MFELKKFRNEHNLTQKDIAELFNIAQSHVSLIEKGNRQMTHVYRTALVNKYGEDEVGKYDSHGDNIVSSGNSTNYGKDNVFTSKELLDVIKIQSEQIQKLMSQNDALIAIIANLSNGNQNLHKTCNS